EFSPDIVFCDIDMAPMNGLTFLKELRRSPDIARAQTLPVIMLTSHNESNV
ncbi:response regulator, partial [Vibrio parahaemolyticus]